MIHDVNINGKTGTGVYLDDNFNPVDVEQATMMKVLFDNGDRVFLKVNSIASDRNKTSKKDLPSETSGSKTP